MSAHSVDFRSDGHPVFWRTSGYTEPTLPVGVCTLVKQGGALGNATATSLAVANALNAGSILSSTTIFSNGPTSGIGYDTGAGDVVTQLTSASTTVILNKICGQITTFALTTAGAAEEIFTFTNSTIAATDIVLTGTTYTGQGTPIVSVKGIAAGSCVIVISNLSASALNDVLVVNFAVFKAVNASA